jgi:hypothetical protein
MLKRAIFCDESGFSGGHKYYCFGALVMGYQRRGYFAAEMAALRKMHRRLDDEVKWNKCSRSNVEFYLALVEYFFKNPNLSFHCMVVDRSWVDTKAYHDGSLELARRKHFTQFLSNKIVALKAAYPGRKLWTRVYVDQLPYSYRKSGEAIEVIGNRLANKLGSLNDLARDVKPINSVIECDSKRYNGIQLCDLLLGAVSDTWNESSTADHKAEVKRVIARYLGWPGDLRSDTRPEARKFNVWWLTDQFADQRPIDTRPVKLLVPLPPIRRYTRR